MDNSIDFSLLLIFKVWFKFKRGKRKTRELDRFSYFLEQNLTALQKDLISGAYHHGGYQSFMVTDNKRRKISVASIRDRVIHRLLYEYLVPMLDETFDFDVWSCRQNKGLIGAILRAQKMTEQFKNDFFWRSDIKRFFDSVDQSVLLKILTEKVKDQKALWLLKEVILSHPPQNRKISDRIDQKGIPIGNLTSQIFANIYLNELDRFIRHQMKPKAYLRYGDDFVIFETELAKLREIRENTIRFLGDKLKLEVSHKNDFIGKTSQSIKFLGVIIHSSGRKLKKRNINRIENLLELKNASSYSSLIKWHQKKKIKEFNWRLMEKIY